MRHENQKMYASLGFEGREVPPLRPSRVRSQ